MQERSRKDTRPCGSLFCVGWENPGQRGTAGRPSPASELSPLPLGCSMRPAALFSAFRELSQRFWDVNPRVSGSCPSSFRAPCSLQCHRNCGIVECSMLGFCF